MEDRKIRIKPIPEYKTESVKMLVEQLQSSTTVLIASIKGLPASQFQSIKSKFRGRAEILVAKKSIVNRALVATGKGALINLKEKIGADVALIFSDIEAYELAGMLIDNQSPSKAKVGDIAPEDITIEEGPTDLMPGPAISELGAVGLKVVVDGGKLIRDSADQGFGFDMSLRNGLYYVGGMSALSGLSIPLLIHHLNEENYVAVGFSLLALVGSSLSALMQSGRILRSYESERKV